MPNRRRLDRKRRYKGHKGEEPLKEEGLRKEKQEGRGRWEEVGLRKER